MTVEKAGELLDKAVNALIIDMKRLTGGEEFYIVAMVAVRNSDGTWTGYQSCYSDEKLGKVIEGYIDGVLQMINIYEQGWDRIEALQKEVERLMLKEAEKQCSSQS